MLHRLREQLGTAGLIVAIVALVAALAGGAYAASGGLTGKQKKEVTKIAKQYAGKRGPAGPAGANGTPGAKGDKGDAGAAGAKGEGVTVTPYTGPECESEEGAKFANATGTAYACNGENGQTGFTETLPSEKSETGAWSAGPVPLEGLAITYVPVSFNIPVAGALQVEFLKEGEGPTGNCPGTAEAPAAKKGFLCVFEAVGFEVKFSQAQSPETGGTGVGRSGALLGFEFESEEGKARGTWIVTAP